MKSFLIFIGLVIFGRLLSNYYYSIYHSYDQNYYSYLYAPIMAGIVLAIWHYKKFGKERAEKSRNQEPESRQVKEGIDEYHK